MGGFENAALIARWAQQHGKMAVISAAYESGLGLSAYILFASYLEMKNVLFASIRSLTKSLLRLSLSFPRPFHDLLPISNLPFSSVSF